MLTILTMKNEWIESDDAVCLTQGTIGFVDDNFGQESEDSRHC